jgi:CheY-like chemotaxis protein
MEKPLAIIVEDDEDLTNLFTEAVRAAGYVAQSFRQGDQALTCLAETTPDLIVLDLHLPGVTGPQILKHLRSDERLKGIRVIVVSADVRLAEYYRDRATIVMHKPVSFVDLRDLVERFMHHQPEGKNE